MPAAETNYRRTERNLMKTIDIIPSKSDAHRALICSALSENPCRVVCSAGSEDIEATENCLAALKEGREEMRCRESGSTLRFLLPVMGALGHKAAFYPEGRLPDRPLSPLYEQLEAHGCRLSPKGSIPFVIEGQLKAGDYWLPGNVSSQYISGFLFALPLLQGDSRICIEGELESRGYVNMTRKVLTDFGIVTEETDFGYTIPGGQKYCGPEVYRVEGDWSNACFWLASGAFLEDGICVRGLSADSLQGDREIVSLLSRFGAKVKAEENQVTVQKGRLRGIEIDARQIPDMVPILSVVACGAEGKTVIRGAQRLRMKESDRLETICQVLRGLGAGIEEISDGLVIEGGGFLNGGKAFSYRDHRIAMMAAVASLICREKVILEGGEAVKKSYPDFFDVMENAGLSGNLERI